MEGFMKNVKAAGAATGRAARKTKINAEIAMQKSSIQSQKKEFGVAVWDSMVQGDQVKTGMVFQKYLSTIQNHENQIKAMLEEIDNIDREAR
jgi:hypothetical protein